jgi:hypothetical protein
MTLNWKKVIQYGLITGVAVWYVSLVGMVEAFDKRDVIESVLSLGLALLVIIGISPGYFVTQKLSANNLARVAIAILITGLIGGLISVLLVILIETIPMRTMFVNASLFSQDSLIGGSTLLIGLLLLSRRCSPRAESFRATKAKHAKARSFLADLSRLRSFSLGFQSQATGG